MSEKPKPLEPLIYDFSAEGREGVNLPEPDVPLTEIPKELRRDGLDLPEVGELDVVRHFTRLSGLNMAIDKNFYPLGSCTMKYNPRLGEDVAGLPGFAHLHPALALVPVVPFMPNMGHDEGLFAEERKQPIPYLPEELQLAVANIDDGINQSRTSGWAWKNWLCASIFSVKLLATIIASSTSSSSAP